MARGLAVMLGLGVCVLSLAAPPAYAAPAVPAPDGPGTSSITRRWQQLGGARSYLGQPLGAETAGPVEGTRIRRFRGGTLYASGTGAWQLQGVIAERFAALDPGEQARLGAPAGDEQDGPLPGSRQNRFAGGTIHWSPRTGAQVLTGAIDDRYSGDPALRAALGLPIGGEAIGYAGSRRVRFQHGEIQWSPRYGAQAVQGAIAERYRELGPGVLGLPTAGEQPGRSPGTRVSTFTEGAIYWSPATGAQAVQGAIAERYRALGGEVSELGLPIGAERTVPTGRVSDFQYGRISFDTAGQRTRVELTRSPESSALWAECRLPVAGGTLTWPANNRTLTIVGGSGPTASLELLVRRNSACGHDRVLVTTARRTGTPSGTFALTEAYPDRTDPYLPQPDRLAIEVEPDADLLPGDAGPGPTVHAVGEPAAGVAVGREQLRLLRETVRPRDTITVVG